MINDGTSSSRAVFCQLAKTVTAYSTSCYLINEMDVTLVSQDITNVVRDHFARQHAVDQISNV